MVCILDEGSQNLGHIPDSNGVAGGNPGDSPLDMPRDSSGDNPLDAPLDGAGDTPLMLDTAEDIPLEVARDRSADVALDVAGDCQPISLRIVSLVWYAVIKAGKRLTRKLFSASIKVPDWMNSCVLPMHMPTRCAILCFPEKEPGRLSRVG